MVQEGTTCDLFRCSSHVHRRATCSVVSVKKNVHQHINVYPWPALSKFKTNTQWCTCFFSSVARGLHSLCNIDECAVAGLAFHRKLVLPFVHAFACKSFLNVLSGLLACFYRPKVQQTCYCRLWLLFFLYLELSASVALCKMWKPQITSVCHTELTFLVECMWMHAANRSNTHVKHVHVWSLKHPLWNKQC